MANRRMISKDDLDSLNFGTLTIQQRYLFWAIMLNADDDGIMPVDIVKARCFPYDEKLSKEEVMRDLEQLKVWSLLSLYNEKKYLEVLNWWSRQFIDIKIYKPTKHPKSPTYQPRPKNLSKDKHSRKTLEQNREGEVSTVQDSLEEKRGGQISKETLHRMAEDAHDVFGNTNQNL